MQWNLETQSVIHFRCAALYYRDSRVMLSLPSVQMDGFKSLTKTFLLMRQYTSFGELLLETASLCMLGKDMDI